MQAPSPNRTRTAFKHLYDGKNYKAALTTLSPALTNCLPTLEWEEEGAIRNDLAITQYKNGLYAQCLATLDQYAEDAAKDDDAAVDGWTAGRRCWRIATWRSCARREPTSACAVEAQ